MNSTQKAYMTAKTAYEIMIAEKTARLTPFAHLLDSDSGIEEYTDIEITVSDELKSDELYTALRAADYKMIDWAYSRVMVLGEAKARATDLQKVYSKRYLPSIRKQLVDLSFRLR